jgi:hypothetical protein
MLRGHFGALTFCGIPVENGAQKENAEFEADGLGDGVGEELFAHAGAQIKMLRMLSRHESFLNMVPPPD